VIYHLQHPSAYLFSGTQLGHAVSQAIVPRELVTGDFDQSEPIGSGPYQFRSGQLQVRYEYERNPTYREAANGLPYIDERIWLPIATDAAADEAAFRSGQSLVIQPLDPTLSDRLVADLSDDIEVIVDDARVSLRDVLTDHADVIIGDAYSGTSVPWHLTTVEYTEEIDRVLSPTGIYTMNVIDYDDLDFIRSEAATLLEVFAEVALFAPPDYLTGAAGGNYILVASQAPLDVDAIEAAIRRRGGAEIGIDGDELTRFIGDANVLTDDFAPVDQMLGSL